ncbi:hypothetical protein AYI85_12560 [Shewanella algae]|nr:hypothetical protein AYI85_12560 [Shewanella algae]TVL02122.1 hypothetical protein AYI84_13820 [Shewanella algae]TVL53331.1 hypothetical protein AYI99_07080 [Shewanella algae]
MFILCVGNTSAGLRAEFYMITETKPWAFSEIRQVIYQAGREWAARRAHQVLQVGRGVLALLAYLANLGVVVGHSKNWQRTSMLNKVVKFTPPAKSAGCAGQPTRRWMIPS